MIAVSAFQIIHTKSFVLTHIRPSPSLHHRLLTFYTAYLQMGIATPTLISRGLALYRSMLTSTETREQHLHLQEWLEYEQTVVAETSTGLISTSTASAIYIIVNNVRAVAVGRSTMQQECDDLTSDIIEKVQDLVITGNDSESSSCFYAERYR